MGAADTLQEALARCGFELPSHAQAVAFAHILAGEDVVLAQPCGSGKTLAYLAPLVQLLDAAVAEGQTPACAQRLSNQISEVLRCRGCSAG